MNNCAAAGCGASFTMPQGCGAATTPSGGMTNSTGAPFAFIDQVAGVLRGQRDLVLAVHQAVELLDIGVEGVRLERHKLLPEVVAVELAQHIPLDVLQAGVSTPSPRSRRPISDRACPARSSALPRRVTRVGIVGDRRHHQRAPGPIALGRALVFGLVRRQLRRHVLHVAAALLEIEREAHVGELERCRRGRSALPLGQQLGVERAGLKAQIRRS